MNMARNTVDFFESMEPFLGLGFTNITVSCLTTSTFEYLIKCASELIISETKKGYFKPILPTENILAFIISSFDEMIRDVTLSKCYSGKETPKAPVQFDEHKLINCIYLSTMYFLGKSVVEQER